MFVEAVHESAHAILNVHFGREVTEIAVFEDGSGITRFVPPVARGENSPATGPIAAKGSVPPAQNGYVMSRPLLDDFTPEMIRESRLRCGWTDRLLFDDLIISMGGRIAHARVASDDEAFERACGDIEQERTTIAVLGVKDPRPWMIPIKARNIAESLVDREWPRILLLATVLSKRMRLSGAEVDEILANAANTSAA